MQAVVALFRARFASVVQYRAAALAGFGTQLFWGIIRTMIFAAFYRGARGDVPLGLDEVIAYIWVSQALFAMVPVSIDADIQALVRSGNVAYEMVRPLGLFRYWFFRSLANRTAAPLMRGIPLFLCAWAFFDLTLPPTPQAFAGWILATAGAVCLSAAISAAMNVSLLFTLSAEGVNTLLPNLTYLLSGLVVPLPLFPETFQTVLDFLPFRGLLDAPLRVYLGRLPAFPGVLLHQAIWTVVILAVGACFCRLAERRMVVQGG